MTAKTNFIAMLATAGTKFSVDGNKVVVETSTNDDKTTFHFKDDGSLERVSCNC